VPVVDGVEGAAHDANAEWWGSRRGVNHADNATLLVWLWSGLSGAVEDPFGAGEFGEGHGSAGVEFLGGDADFGAHAVLFAVGEGGAGVDHDGGRVYFVGESLCGGDVGGADCFGVAAGVAADVVEGPVDAVNNLPEGHSDRLRTGLVSIDATNGGILALYGGPDYLTDQVNSSTQAVAQAGSTYKPFALIAGLEGGLTLSNGYDAYSPMQVEGSTFNNFQNAQFPWINLIQATTDSVNTAYVQLNRDVGPDATNEVAKRAGYPEDTVGMDETLQNVLGSASPHTLDIAASYATFASQGRQRDAHIISSVTNGAGSVSYSPSTDGEKAFDEDVMADATYAMQQVVNSGSGKTALSLNRPVAAKTGSSRANVRLRKTVCPPNAPRRW